jgi:hypothetical protein
VAIEHAPGKPTDVQKWRFRLDWAPPVRCDALVIYHKRFPAQRNLLKLMTGTQPGAAEGAVRPDSDSWWREHLTCMHVTPSPIRGEAHLTLVLEGTRESLGHATNRDCDMYERPLLFFCPKSAVQRFALEPALR